MPAPKIVLNYLRARWAVLAILLASPSGVPAQSNPYIDTLVEKLDQQDPDAAPIDLLCQIAMRYTDVDPAEGLRYGRMALELARRRGGPGDEARASNALASNWLLLLNIDSSVHYFKAAGDLFASVDDRKGLADVTGNLGHVAYNTGQFDEALRYFLESLALFEELGHAHGVANQHASIGNTYMVLEKYQDALIHDSLAFAGFKAIGDSMGMAMVMGNMANIFSEQQDFDRTAMYYEQAIGIYERLDLPLGVARNLANMAGSFNDLHRHREALDVATRGLRIFNAQNFPIGSGYCLTNIGLAYLQSFYYRDSLPANYSLVPGSPGELLAKAIQNLDESLGLIDKLEAPDNFEEAHRYLAMAYKFAGRYDKALYHHEIYADMKDSLASVERAERIEQLTTQREIAVRDKQIELDKLRLKVKRNERIYFIIGLGLLAGGLALLYRNYRNQKASNRQLGLLNGQITTVNLQLESQNDRLSQTLEELTSTQAQLIEAERQKENEILRSRISRDIHDDISSGLSKIAWMTEAVRSQAIDGQPADPTLLARIGTHARDTVAKLGEIIWSTKPESDNVRGLTSYCRAFLNQYLEGVPIRRYIDFPESNEDAALNPELRRNLFLVLKEAVHNAVKYSQATDLHVTFTIDNGQYRLVVEDNGIGMSGDANALGGNGLRNMRERMSAVQGRCDVTSAPGQGTRIYCSGPVY